MARKVLIGTQKPFAKAAVDGMKEIFDKAGYETVLLEKYAEQSDLIAAVKDVEALVVRSDKVTSEVLDAAEKLKIVVRGGAGYDNVDCAKAKEKGVVVMNTPGQNSNAVAELAFGMMLMLARNGFNGKAGTELRGKKIGIHAFGNIGVYVSKIAKGFGMDVCAFDPFVPAEAMKEHGVEPMSTVEEMYSSCDYISLHLPLLDATRESINYGLMSKMKDGAALLNTARKEVVNEADLMKVMEEKGLKYASDIAPAAADEIASKFEGQFFFTPKKMGAQTAEANVNAGLAAANQIVNFFEKGDVTFQVNK